jgi:peptide/nickel transport system ATP-binding protein
MGAIRSIFTEPLHPYTQLLIDSLPTLESKETLRGIPGIAPSLLNPPPGCVFHPRCPQVMAHCSQRSPALVEQNTGHWAACHLYG